MSPKTSQNPHSTPILVYVGPAIPRPILFGKICALHHTSSGAHLCNVIITSCRPCPALWKEKWKSSLGPCIWVSLSLGYNTRVDCLAWGNWWHHALNGNSLCWSCHPSQNHLDEHNILHICRSSQIPWDMTM
jgi:hypothetical protein